MVLSKYFTAPIFPGCLDNVMLRRVSIHLPPSDTTVTLCPISRSAGIAHEEYFQLLLHRHIGVLQAKLLKMSVPAGNNSLFL
jgi:hypothetical protein